MSGNTRCDVEWRPRPWASVTRSRLGAAGWHATTSSGCSRRRARALELATGTGRAAAARSAKGLLPAPPLAAAPSARSRTPRAPRSSSVQAPPTPDAAARLRDAAHDFTIYNAASAALNPLAHVGGTARRLDTLEAISSPPPAARWAACVEGMQLAPEQVRGGCAAPRRAGAAGGPLSARSRDPAKAEGTQSPRAHRRVWPHAPTCAGARRCVQVRLTLRAPLRGPPWPRMHAQERVLSCLFEAYRLTIAGVLEQRHALLAAQAALPADGGGDASEAEALLAEIEPCNLQNVWQSMSFALALWGEVLSPEQASSCAQRASAR